MFDFYRFLGSFITSLIFPIILLIIFKLIRPMRKYPGISYGIPGLLAGMTPFLAVNTPLGIKLAASAATLGLFYWGWRREVSVRALKPGEAKP